MRIDRNIFLHLTAALATACHEEPTAPPAVAMVPTVSSSTPASPPESAQVSAPVTPGDAAATSPSALASTSAPVSAPAPSSDPTCSNDIGTLDACAGVGPACEGLAAECRRLGEDLRPRIAQRFAECFAQAREPACRDKKLGGCMRSAVESACVEPSAASRCQSIMASCRAAGRAPRYTLDQCAKILSATLARGPGKWTQVDAERMGSSFAEGCSLDYVLPYQPYGFMWR